MNKPPRSRRDLISTRSLDPIQDRIRLPKEPPELGCAHRFRSYANRNGELRGKVLLHKGTRFASLAKTLRDRDGLLDFNAQQKDHKLISAQSPE
jgi:hypothetical protein